MNLFTFEGWQEENHDSYEESSDCWSNGIIFLPYWGMAGCCIPVIPRRVRRSLCRHVEGRGWCTCEFWTEPLPHRKRCSRRTHSTRSRLHRLNRREKDKIWLSINVFESSHLWRLARRKPRFSCKWSLKQWHNFPYWGMAGCCIPVIPRRVRRSLCRHVEGRGWCTCEFWTEPLPHRKRCSRHTNSTRSRLHRLQRRKKDNISISFNLLWIYSPLKVGKKKTTIPTKNQVITEAMA